MLNLDPFTSWRVIVQDLEVNLVSLIFIIITLSIFILFQTCLEGKGRFLLSPEYDRHSGNH
jgi:hypothetical protein